MMERTGEFYATVNLADSQIHDLLAGWQHYYNWERPHSSLGSKTPMDKYFSLSAKTPFFDEAYEDYNENSEPLQNQNY